MPRVLHPRLRFIEPQLASPVDKPPEGKHWIHEIKHDGYRCQVLLERGQARVFTRNGYDWSNRYPSIVRAAANLRCQSAIIDGEAIVQSDDGASDFEALQSSLRQQPHNILLYAFDLMHLDGIDLRQQTLSERRAQLEHLVLADAESRIQFSEEFDGDGDALFQACAKHELEGIVSKHVLAPLPLPVRIMRSRCHGCRTVKRIESTRLGNAVAMVHYLRIVNARGIQPWHRQDH
jgi:bifunctional non-homologous end joining protein LigD